MFSTLVYYHIGVQYSKVHIILPYMYTYNTVHYTLDHYRGKQTDIHSYDRYIVPYRFI